MGTSDEDAADAAFKALGELFSRRLQPGKSRYSGIRYVPEMQNGKIVFVVNADDLAFHEAFDGVLDESLQSPKSEIQK